MHEKSNAGCITDIVEIIKGSDQQTVVGIADETLGRWQRNIAKIYLDVHCIELPVISYSSRERGYSIKLSLIDEKRQLAQISALILVVLEEIDLSMLNELNSFEELLEHSAIWKEHFNNIMAAFTAKNIQIL